MGASTTSCPPCIAGVFAALAVVVGASAATLDERCVGAAQFDDTLADGRQQLEAALERDQQFRKQMHSSNASATESEPSLDARQRRLRDQQKLDLDNLKLLDSIVCRFGWPDVDTAGQRASFAAFLIVQHAGLAVQETYLPTLQKAAASKQAEPSQVAILEDRINVRNKRPQLYASQLCFMKGGGYGWPPIQNEDEAAIDAAREAVGLGTIKSYAANFKIEYVPPSKKACDR